MELLSVQAFHAQAVAAATKDPPPDRRGMGLLVVHLFDLAADAFTTSTMLLFPTREPLLKALRALGRQLHRNKTPLVAASLAAVRSRHKPALRIDTLHLEGSSVASLTHEGLVLPTHPAAQRLDHLQAIFDGYAAANYAAPLA